MYTYPTNYRLSGHLASSNVFLVLFVAATLKAHQYVAPTVVCSSSFSIAVIPSAWVDDLSNAYCFHSLFVQCTRSLHCIPVLYQMRSIHSQILAFSSVLALSTSQSSKHIETFAAGAPSSQLVVVSSGIEHSWIFSRYLEVGIFDSSCQKPAANGGLGGPGSSS